MASSIDQLMLANKENSDLRRQVREQAAKIAFDEKAVRNLAADVRCEKEKVATLTNAAVELTLERDFHKKMLEEQALSNKLASEQAAERKGYAKIPLLATLAEKINFLRNYPFHKESYYGQELWELFCMVISEMEVLQDKAERQAMQDREAITMLQCDIKNREKYTTSLVRQVATLKETLRGGEAGGNVRVEGELVFGEAKAGWEAGGVKHDSAKPRFDLIDSYAMEQLAEVLTFGAIKYAAHNWRKGIAYSRLIAAAMRHIHAFNEGQDCDNETGLPHAAHAMCCMMFLTWMQYNRSDMDDRWVDNDPSRQPVEGTPKEKSLREELADHLDDMINSDLSAKGVDKSPSPFWKNRSASGDEEPDFIQEAMHHADAIFSQYGVAPRAKKWEPLALGAWKAIKVGDIIKLRGRALTWVVKEIDVKNMTIAVAYSKGPDANLMSTGIPITDIEQVQR
jgi:hypothetical protein